MKELISLELMRQDGVSKGLDKQPIVIATIDQQERTAIAGATIQDFMPVSREISKPAFGLTAWSSLKKRAHKKNGSKCSGAPPYIRTFLLSRYLTGCELKIWNKSIWDWNQHDTLDREAYDEKDHLSNFDGDCFTCLRLYRPRI
jgi:hypothetical protein